MKPRGRGSILNMSSISWIIPTAGLPVYVAAKAAIVGLTAPSPTNSAPTTSASTPSSPGAILTERQKQLWFTETCSAEILARQALKRQLHPEEEVARLALFLAADDSSAINNQSYVIDGGWI
jgi:NAD(P)-dependent dehydrogenase (short-subunit alcohol dehydrogenase family)